MSPVPSPAGSCRRSRCSTTRRPGRSARGAGRAEVTPPATWRVGFVHRPLYSWTVPTVGYGEVLARFGHALSDPTRARLLLALRDAPGYPADLADVLGVTRQNLSNHLAC